MKKTIFISLGILTLLSGCTQSPSASTPTQENPKSLQIVTSFYPLAEIAQRVGDNRVTVKNLVPAGAEPHDYEPAPQDIVSLYQAKLIIYNGAGLEPWLEKIIPAVEKNGVQSLNMSKTFQNFLERLPENEEENGNENSDGQDAETQKSGLLPFDPHIWLDPVRYLEEIHAVAQKLGEVDPGSVQTYEENAQKYANEILALHSSFENGLKNCKIRFFVTNHAAFAYLAKRYNLEMIPIAGLSPESEPSPKVLSDLTKLLKSRGIKYILVETLVSPKIGEALAREVGAKTLVLNPIEGLSKEEIAAGGNYVSVMKENLKNLQIALDCQ